MQGKTQLSDVEASPYRVSTAALEIPLTSRGFSERQCFWRFMAFGAFAACAGGPILILLSRWRVDTWIQLLAPGILFGVGLWLATQRYIGQVSTLRKFTLIGGCLVSFGICGVVYEFTLSDGWWQPQPWTWSLVKPCVYGPVSGFAALVTVVRIVAGSVKSTILLAVWVVGSIMGFITLFIVDEFGWRLQRFDIEVLAIVGSGVLQTSMTALIGWQLAAANVDSPQPVP